MLDEADRLLDESFEPDLNEIVSHLPQKRQTLLFSATMTSTMAELKHAGLVDAVEYNTDVQPTTVSTLRQHYVFIPATVRDGYLVRILRTSDAKSVILFASTRRFGFSLLLTQQSVRAPLPPA